jgi:hypothetical protein
MKMVQPALQSCRLRVQKSPTSLDCRVIGQTIKPFRLAWALQGHLQGAQSPEDVATVRVPRDLSQR